MDKKNFLVRNRKHELIRKHREQMCSFHLRLSWTIGLKKLEEAGYRKK